MVKARVATWGKLKAKLAKFDRAGLLGIMKDLHALDPAKRRS